MPWNADAILTPNMAKKFSVNISPTTCKYNKWDNANSNAMAGASTFTEY